MTLNITPDDILTRLKGCSAVHSLSNEQDIVRLLHRRKWRVEHGPFYRDPNTCKLRKLDVAARRAWHRKIRKGPQSVTIELHIEVKSFRDFHLVFAPLGYANRIELCQREWIGFHEKEFRDALGKGGATIEELRETMKWFDDACFKDGQFRVHRLFVDPPPGWFQSSAFRETNIGGEKDLDASVFWKAMQCVFGAVQSSRKRFLDEVDDILVHAVALAPQVDEPVPYVVSQEMQGRMQQVVLYHPIVFVESHLWSFSEGRLEPREWCRFYTLGDGWPERWCDIVSISSASKYIKQLTNFYAIQMQRLRAKADA